MSENMTDLEYHSHPAIGREQLLLLADSPSLFHAIRTGGLDAEEVRKVMEDIDPSAKKADAFGIGEATHRVVFEPDTVIDRFIEIPAYVLTSNGHRRGKAYEDWRDWALAAGKVPIMPGKMAVARMVAASAKRTLQPLLVPEAIHEQPMFWTERVELDGEIHEVECRGKPDYLVAILARQFGVVVDLKTCNRLNEFKYAIRDWRYWMQSVHYRAGFRAVHGFWPRFYFAAVSKRPPFHCRLVQLDDETEGNAERRREELLVDLVRRQRDGDWSDPVQTAIETVKCEVA